jgi:hypothetical protein
METETELFNWNSFDLLLKENEEIKEITFDIKKDNIIQNEFNNLEAEDLKLNNKEKSIKIINKIKKYSFDIGATFITINNSVFCFNKNNIQGQSNSYLKVDRIKKLNFKEKYLIVKNIYSKLNGPRYRVTNVLILIFCLLLFLFF